MFLAVGGDPECHDEAVIAAGANRFRPIAMTTIAAILALLPLAIGLGQGSDMQKPLAVAIISGLLVQLPLVLCIMPVLYNLTQGRRGDGPALPAAPNDAAAPPVEDAGPDAPTEN